MTVHTPGASLKLQGLTKEYPKQVAVSGVDLSIRSGEFLTFLGPSGSGKTTTLNMVAGFVAPTSGTIELDGQDLTSLPPHKRGIGMVFQNYALFPHMTVRENIGFPLRQRRVDKTTMKRQVDEALALVHLDGLGDRYPKQLSGGQQQRVAFARAVVFRPRLLLMDEPLGALDRKLREWLQQEIRVLHQELGITFLYVTHDQDEAISLSDRVAVFKDGKIDQVATPQDLYRKPATRFVANFLGDANLIDCSVESSGDVAKARTSDGYVYEAEPREQLAAGAEAVLMVRPESVLVWKRADEVPLNCISRPGRIADIVYQGASSRVVFDHGADFKVFATVNPLEASTLAIGDEVLVGWSRSDAALLPA